MAILNGFLRGAHDPEITANIDNKKYSGVATEMYNFVGTKRGALSRRAPFKFHQELNSSSYIIPFVYDANNQYLIHFFKANDNTVKYKLLSYDGNSVVVSSIGTSPQVIQPIFTSNNQDGFITAQSSVVSGIEAYQRFNDERTSFAGSDGYWVSIKYPKPAKLYEVSVLNRDTFSGIGPTITEIVNFVIEGSNDNINWDLLSYTSNVVDLTTVCTLTENPTYLYYRIRVIGAVSSWAVLGKIKLKVELDSSEDILYDTPYSIEQIKELHWTNENKRIIFFHPDVAPQEIIQVMQDLQQTGLTFTGENGLGYPTFGCFYQERLCLGGFTKANRQFNMSQSNPKDLTQFNFTLPTNEIVSTSAMQFVIRNAKYPLRESLSGRNMLYLQCVDGLATVSSGGDEVPLTPVQVAATLRNHTSFSDIPAVYQEELAFLVGSDYKTVYGMDYDFNVMRVRTIPINEHCLSYFESGIAQMIPMKGQLPYIVFRLNNGKILVATAYKTETSFSFHLYPLELGDGVARCIAPLFNPETGYDTLFAIIEHQNGIISLESIESSHDVYTSATQRAYFEQNIMLDSSQKISVPQKSDIWFKYSGTKSDIGRYLFTLKSETHKMKYVWSYDNVQSNQTNDVYTLVENVVAGTPIYDSATNEQIAVANGGNSEQIAWQQTPIPGSSITVGVVAYRASQFDNEGTFMQDGGSIDLPDGEIKLIWGNESIICKNCLFDDSGMWAEVSAEPLLDINSTSYQVPKKTWKIDEYNNLNVQVWNGDDFIDAEFENTPYGTNIVLKKAIYGGTIGIPYKSRAVFENLVGVDAAPYEKTITNIAACITYATKLKLGTESIIDEIGFSNYHYNKWQDRILPDENLRNIPLADSPRKDKKIVLECDYPFPANITFITYDIKTTGVR